MLQKTLKVLALTLVATALLSNPMEAIGIQPLWATIAEIAPSLDIDSLGEAESPANVIAPGVDKISITVALQQNRNGTWYTLKSWTENVYDDHGYCIGYKSVDSGYQYRTKSYVYTYINNILMDSTSVTSSIKYY